MKIAIFVEGQTELIVVRELLLKYFEYTDISIECRTLFTDTRLQNAEYDYLTDHPKRIFQIINIGNDNAVLSRILNRETFMWNAGYNLIVGLRDMYSKSYRKASNNVDEVTISKFIEGARKTIESNSQRPENIFLCFAIMEVEAWILGIRGLFEKLSPELTNEFIEDKLGYRLDAIDPEKAFFHPAEVVSTIYSLAGKNYRKKKGDIEAIMRQVDKHSISELRDAPHCSSFTIFLDKILK